ncbi:MAG: PilN domain-containing protein [Nitrospirae bacterium]|nr:PilN domain-containing protein [Nitrospirota bacterium]
MIKINLLPQRRKKKPKPIPSFLITSVGLTAIALIVMVGLVFVYNSRLSSKKAQYKMNETKIAELKAKIKKVENYEKLNKTIQEKNSVIEQLRKNQSIPVKLLDEASSLLPNGVWLKTMTLSGENVNIDGYAFANSDIVSYVDNIKSSQTFTDVFLQESKSTKVETANLYMFKLTFKIKG